MQKPDLVPPPPPGLRARDIRKRLKLTMDQVGARAELSKGHLSRFERGEKSLSVAALLRLATALETSAAVLLGEELDGSEIHLVKNGEGAGTGKGDKSKQGYRLLGGGATSQHDSFHLILPEEHVHNATVFHGGRELLYVLAGNLEVSVGDRVFQLDQGDYLEFPGNIPHSLASRAGTASVLLIVVK